MLFGEQIHRAGISVIDGRIEANPELFLPCISADASASTVPSPPFAIGQTTISASANTRRIPRAVRTLH